LIYKDILTLLKGKSQLGRVILGKPDIKTAWKKAFTVIKSVGKLLVDSRNVPGGIKCADTVC
jgi:hypothetical protein